MQRASDKILRAIGVTCELTGTELSKPALAVMANDLSSYPEEQVFAALVRCRKELRGRGTLTIAAIIERLPDGRPSPEEAWAMIPRDELASVIWTDEVRQAWSVAIPLLKEGERVPARMAFLEAYRRIVQEARDAGKRPVWVPSLGTDLAGREQAVVEAVEKGRLTNEQAIPLLPDASYDSLSRSTKKVLGLLEAPKDGRTQRRMMDLIDNLPMKKVPGSDSQPQGS